MGTFDRPRWNLLQVVGWIFIRGAEFVHDADDHGIRQGCSRCLARWGRSLDSLTMGVNKIVALRV
jgi:hypothetical protein